MHKPFEPRQRRHRRSCDAFNVAAIRSRLARHSCSHPACRSASGGLVAAVAHGGLCRVGGTRRELGSAQLSLLQRLRLAERTSGDGPGSRPAPDALQSPAPSAAVPRHGVSRRSTVRGAARCGARAQPAGIYAIALAGALASLPGTMRVRSSRLSVLAAGGLIGSQPAPVGGAGACGNGPATRSSRTTTTSSSPGCTGTSATSSVSSCRRPGSKQ